MGETYQLTTSLTPSSSTDAVRLYSSDKTIATVGAISGKVTGKGEGKTTIKVYAKATQTTKLSSTYNKVTLVNVYVGDHFESASQISGTEILIKVHLFDDTNVRMTDFSVVNQSNKASYPVKQYSYDKETKELTLETYSALKDGKQYEVSYKGTSASFTATDGTVASISIVPTEVYAGEETEIFVQCVDVNGVIVDQYSKTTMPGSVEFWQGSINGSGYWSADGKLYLEKSGSHTNASATYQYNKQGMETGKLETGNILITAITKPEGIENVSYVIANTAKADTVLPTTKSEMLAVGETDKSMFVWLYDMDGDRITDYSNLRFSTSDDSILKLTEERPDAITSGLALIPIKNGTAYVIIQDSNGTVQSTIPVTVAAERKETVLELSVSTVAISNAAAGFSRTVDATVKDQYGEKMKIEPGQLQYTAVQYPTGAEADAAKLATVENAEILIQGKGITAGSYVYQVAYKNSLKKIINVIVQEPNASEAERKTINESSETVDVRDNEDILIYGVLQKGSVNYDYFALTDYKLTDSVGKDVTSRFLTTEGAIHGGLRFQVSYIAANGLKATAPAGRYTLTVKTTNAAGAALTINRAYVITDSRTENEKGTRTYFAGSLRLLKGQTEKLTRQIYSLIEQSLPITAVEQRVVDGNVITTSFVPEIKIYSSGNVTDKYVKDGNIMLSLPETIPGTNGMVKYERIPEGVYLIQLGTNGIVECTLILTVEHSNLIPIVASAVIPAPEPLTYKIVYSETKEIATHDLPANSTISVNSTFPLYETVEAYCNATGAVTGSALECVRLWAQSTVPDGGDEYGIEIESVKDAAGNSINAGFVENNKINIVRYIGTEDQYEALPAGTYTVSLIVHEYKFVGETHVTSTKRRVVYLTVRNVIEPN